MDKGLMKRKFTGHNKNNKGNKRKVDNSGFKKPKMDPKFKKMLMRKARNYDSGSDEEGDNDNANDNDTENVNEKEKEKEKEEEATVVFEKSSKKDQEFYAEKEEKEENFDDDDLEEGDKEEISEDEDENGEIQPGITRFSKGCAAFSVAFKKIVNMTEFEDVLGPVLSAQKKLVGEKLAEEEVDRKAKSEAKKEKLLVSEKGHVKPENYLNTHEKFLISVATKGVVKLFNAVNKAQHAQKGLNPLRRKDEKVIKKRRKDAFFSELGKSTSDGMTSKVGASTDGERPGWAPLRDDFMLTSSKLKDWDKKKDTVNEDNLRKPATDFSSDDD